MRAQAEAVAAELLKGNIRVEAGKRKLVETRSSVEDGWRSVADLLLSDGRKEIAEDVRRFVERLPSMLTERDWLRNQLCASLHCAQAGVLFIRNRRG